MTILTIATNPSSWPDCTVEQLIECLETLDDEYFNGDELVPDKVYDTLHHYTQKAYPSHVYFTGVGSKVRGGKVKLPYSMPSLNQEQIGDIVDWVKDNKLTKESVVITDKMDGASLMVVYGADGKLQIAYSRGNGTEGADVTRHVVKMKSIPQQVKGPMVVRAEVEISEPNFNVLKTKIKSQSGRPYVNARNCIAGIMNSSDRPDFVYDYIDVIAYQILGFQGSKSEQLFELTDQGFAVPFFNRVKGSELTDEYLAAYIALRKGSTPFAIDGIVIDVDNAATRAAMDIGIGSGNPKSSIKYKVADATNQFIATVKGVEWNTSKHGYLKPTVNFEPFPLCGVTVSNATGFNARFIVDNGIGPGAKCRVVRSGEVIPYIEQVVTSVSVTLPEVEFEWTETDVDIKLVTNSDEVYIQQLVDFCSSLDLPHLKDGNVRLLYEAGTKTCDQLVNLSMVEALKVLGANGIKAYHGIQERLEKVTLAEVMGSVTFFGRGVGKRKFKSLISQLGEDYNSWTKSQIMNADGFDDVTAQKILDGRAQFNEFYKLTEGAINYTGKVLLSNALKGQKICMTGFRDADMAARIEELGGEVASGVSSNTTILVCTDPDSKSGKAQKARDVNSSGKGKVEILSVEQFKGRLETLV